MYSWLLSKFSTTFYIQIWENRLKITDIENNQVFEELPLVAIQTTGKGEKIIVAVGNNAKLEMGENTEVLNPFLHPRVLIADFTVAEKLLQLAFKKLNTGKLFATKPRAIVHPMVKTEGGLSNIENRAFLELAYGAGAYDVIVYEGTALPTSGMDYERIKEQLEPKLSIARNSQTSVLSTIFVAVIVVAIFIGLQNGN